MFPWELLKKVFRCFYDNMFFLIFFNILWFIIIFPLAFISFQGILMGLILAALALIPIGPLCLSGLKVLSCLVRGDKARFRDLFLNFKSSFLPGLAAFFYTVVIYVILIVDIVFFYNRIEQTYLMIPLAIIIFYLILFFSMSQLYFWGLTVDYLEFSFWERIKKSLLLVLDNFLESFLWLLFMVAFVTILIVILPSIPILFFGLTGLTIIVGNDMILQQYDFAKEEEGGLE